MLKRLEFCRSFENSESTAKEVAPSKGSRASEICVTDVSQEHSMISASSQIRKSKLPQINQQNSKISVQQPMEFGCPRLVLPLRDLNERMFILEKSEILRWEGFY